MSAQLCLQLRFRCDGRRRLVRSPVATTFAAASQLSTAGAIATKRTSFMSSAVAASPASGRTSPIASNRSPTATGRAT